MEQNYPDIEISEDPRVMDSYTLIRSFEDGHIGLVPPHVGSQFLPLRTVPLEMDMKWPVGFVYREPRSAVLNQFIEVSKEVFSQIIKSITDRPDKKDGQFYVLFYSLSLFLVSLQAWIPIS